LLTLLSIFVAIIQRVGGPLAMQISAYYLVLYTVDVHTWCPSVAF
jgi:hypothetical protein